MNKYFNIAGPCHPDEHYMMPSEARCQGVISLIEQRQYFVIHAARQSGKTTLLLELERAINDSGKYYALYCSVESAQGILDPEKGIPAIVRTLTRAIRFTPVLKKFPFAPSANFGDFNNILIESLTSFCSALDKPLVILFDEVDCLSNGTLISFLRQLREGYVNRSRASFVHSVGLIGMRNIRDYKGKIREERETLGSASPFNIVTESLTLRDFTQEETGELHSQHAQAVGQTFSTEVTQRIYYHAQGQPWLTNAIAREIIVKILGNDFAKEIIPPHVGQAVEAIIHRRDTHIDSLLERLKEDRVRKVIDPVIAGKERVFDPMDDDFQYVQDLGLLKNEGGSLRPSNPIYAEVIVRYLSMKAQNSIDDHAYPVQGYYAGNQLDMKKLLTDFQIFWRENAAIWQERFEYKESAPHLVLMAFLQRVVNAGGHIIREMATETRRLDLCIHFKGNRYPIEIKLRYDNKTYKEGKKQLSDYMETLGCDEGWLIVFDRRKRQPWKNKLFWKTSRAKGMQIYAVGC